MVDHNKNIIFQSKLCSDKYVNHFLEHRTLLNHALLEDQKSSILNVHYSAILMYKKMEELINHLFNLEVLEPKD
jgi:hypothetical protein